MSAPTPYVETLYTLATAGDMEPLRAAFRRVSHVLTCPLCFSRMCGVAGPSTPLPNLDANHGVDAQLDIILAHCNGDLRLALYLALNNMGQLAACLGVDGGHQ